MRLTRYFTYIYVSVWKIMAFVISSLLILHIKGENVGHLFTMLSSAFSDHKITVTSIKSITSGTLPDLSEILTGDITEVVNADFNTPIYVLLLQITGAYFAYVFGKRITWLELTWISKLYLDHLGEGTFKDVVRRVLLIEDMF